MFVHSLWMICRKHTNEGVLKIPRDVKLRWFWFRHDQIFNVPVHNAETLLTVLLRLLVGPAVMKCFLIGSQSLNKEYSSESSWNWRQTVSIWESTKGGDCDVRTNFISEAWKRERFCSFFLLIMDHLHLSAGPSVTLGCYHSFLVIYYFSGHLLIIYITIC